MEILHDGVIAFLSAVGLASLLWSLAGLMVRRPAPAIHGLMLVLPLQGNTLSAEADLRELRRLRRALPGSRLALHNCGLSEEGLALVRTLARREKNILFIDTLQPLPPP